MKKVKVTFLIIIIILFAVLAALLSDKLLSSETNYARKLSFTDDEQVLAIFYVGGIEEAYDYSIIEKYYTKSDINDFETIELEGEERYLVVPRYNNKVTISSLTMTNDGGTATRVVKEITEPFFLNCNVSDIFSNAEINLKYNDKEYKYSPYISLKDGSVVTEEFVLLVTK